MSVKQQIDARTNSLSMTERDFLRQAEQKYRSNANWFEFEDFAFGMRSPLFSRQRSHLNVLRHPLYLALKEMWLDLGIRQGLVSPSKRQEEHLARRKAQGSGASGQERHRPKERNVETSHSPTNRRVSK